jgi:hypothetical protein
MVQGDTPRIMSPVLEYLLTQVSHVVLPRLCTPWSLAVLIWQV